MKKIKIYKGGDKRQRFQGDISIIKVEEADCEFSPLPSGGIIVGHSESGHNHRVIVKEREKSDVEFGQDKEGYFIRVNSGTAELVHEKVGGHETQTIPQGIYFFGKQYEYFEAEDKKVID